MPPAIVNIEPSTASERLADGEAVLLDVREDNEWQAGHATGAVHVPLGQLDPSRFVGQSVVAVCRSGNRSGKAAVILAEAGVDVVNLNGGMQAWADRGLPVVAHDGRPGTVT